MPTAAEIKKALKEAGLEVYRTRGNVVYLADRVRENLLMDAGTFILVRGMPEARVSETRVSETRVSETRVSETRVSETRVSEAPAHPAGSAPEAASTLAVGFLVRAQRNDFPHDGEEHLFERARQLAASAVDRGYRETEAEVRKVKDPGDGERTLDTWCEVSFEKEVGDLATAIVELRFALALEKAAAPTRLG